MPPKNSWFSFAILPADKHRQRCPIFLFLLGRFAKTISASFYFSVAADRGRNGIDKLPWTNKIIIRKREKVPSTAKRKNNFLSLQKLQSKNTGVLQKRKSETGKFMRVTVWYFYTAGGASGIQGGCRLGAGFCLNFVLLLLMHNVMSLHVAGRLNLSRNTILAKASPIEWKNQRALSHRRAI